jgi:hypothetical protein
VALQNLGKKATTNNQGDRQAASNFYRTTSQESIISVRSSTGLSLMPLDRSEGDLPPVYSMEREAVVEVEKVDEDGEEETEYEAEEASSSERNSVIVKGDHMDESLSPSPVSSFVTSGGKKFSLSSALGLYLKGKRKNNVALQSLGSAPVSNQPKQANFFRTSSQESMQSVQSVQSVHKMGLDVGFLPPPRTSSSDLPPAYDFDMNEGDDEGDSAQEKDEDEY